jgi:hypothetical protein
VPSFGPLGPVFGDAVSLSPSSTRTASGSGSAYVMGQTSTLRLTLAVTAASGTTPSLTVTVEHSPDGTTWAAHSAFTAATATTTQRKTFGGVDRFARVSWAITGTTPSFTFDVSGEAV